MASGELERDHRSPRVPGEEGPAQSRRTDDGARIGHDRIEAVPARGLRGQAVPTGVVRDDPEAADQARHHQIPDPLRGGEPVVEEEGRRRGRGTFVDANGEPDPTVSADVHLLEPWLLDPWLRHTRRRMVEEFRSPLADHANAGRVAIVTGG